MKSVLIAMAAAAALGAPAFAQEHAAHHPASEAAKPGDTAKGKPGDMASMSPEQMRRHCAMMATEAKTPGASDHGASADKPGGGAPTEAQMKMMHEMCAAHMAQDKKDAAPTKP
jgi:hypothetical protein